MGGAIGMIFGNLFFGGASIIICAIALILVVGSAMSKK